MNHVIQINLSKGGVPKLPISEAYISALGIEGDIQKDKRYHGGPDRAVSLFSIEIINRLIQEGHPISAGSTGENITMSFLDYHLLKPEVKIKIGDEVILQITAYAAPCKTIRASFLNEIFIRISQKLYPNESRLYTRVIQEGTIKIGDPISIID